MRVACTLELSSTQSWKRLFTQKCAYTVVFVCLLLFVCVLSKTGLRKIWNFTRCLLSIALKHPYNKSRTFRVACTLMFTKNTKNDELACFRGVNPTFSYRMRVSVHQKIWCAKTSYFTSWKTHSPFYTFLGHILRPAHTNCEKTSYIKMNLYEQKMTIKGMKSQNHFWLQSSFHQHF